MKAIEKQVILVTGATDGIGKITAGKLAKMGATVLLHGRNREKCARTMTEIQEETGNEAIRCYVGDFSSLAAVREVAKNILSDYSSLDVLINNAGVLPGKSTENKRLLSEDGHELCFVVNYLAPFLLTHLLMPALQSASPSRIVNISSIAQKRIEFDNLMLERDYDPIRAYARSKLALTMFTFDIAKRLEKEQITANCLHPGSLLDTKMVRESTWTPQGSADSGADVVLHIATNKDLEDKTGLYFNEKKEARAHDQAYDDKARSKLWQLGEQLTGIVGSKS